MEDQLEKIIELLGKPERKYQDLEFLAYYLKRYEDIKRFFRSLNHVVISSLCRQFYLSQYKKGEQVHGQDEAASMYYLVLKGSISLFDGPKLLGKVAAGKSIGEREIIKDSLYPHTGISSAPLTCLLTLSRQDFTCTLGEVISQENAKKLQYLRTLLPNFSRLSQSLQERLLQGLRLENYSKGEVILGKGVVSDSLLFVAEGECVLITNSGYVNKEIVRVSKGSTYAEECIVHGLPTEYTLISKHESTVAFIKKSDVASSFPDSIMKLLRKNYEFKKMQRDKVMDFSPTPQEEDIGFPLASRYARRKLSEIKSRSHMLSPSQAVSFHGKAYSDLKDQLLVLRDSSPDRVTMPRLRRNLHKSLDVDRLSITLH